MRETTRRMIAMMIVNQILDLAGTPVIKRQEINDKCDKFVLDALKKYEKL